MYFVEAGIPSAEVLAKFGHHAVLVALAWKVLREAASKAARRNHWDLYVLNVVPPTLDKGTYGGLVNDLDLPLSSAYKP